VCPATIEEQELPEVKPLKTAEQAVLTAVGQLGHGNVHQLVEASGYARSTVDKALKVLSGASLIVEYDTGAEPAEGAPTQWQLADDDASAPIGTDADNADDAADEDDGDEDVVGTRERAESASRPKNRRVMQIAGALVAYPNGATMQDLTEDTDIPMPALDRLLTAMVTGGAAVLIDDTRPRRWKSGTTHAADIDPFPVTPRCEQCTRTLPAGWTPPAASTEGEGRAAPDPKVLMLAGAMFPYGDGGASASALANDSRLAQELVARLLSAMETAGVAARVITDDGDGEQTGEPLWVLNPGPLHTVDPEPKCTGCGRPRPGSRSSGKTPAGTRRADALGRNVLRDATLRFLIERPGVVLAPGAIAAALATELGRDVVSPGAVKNNCEGFANEGKITLVSSKPWLFAYHPSGEATPEGEGQPENTGGA
jgi:hypothetical protein